MKRSIELMTVVVVVLLFAFAMSGLAQESKSALAQQSKSALAQQSGPIAPQAVSESVVSTLPRSAPGILFIPKSSQPQTPPAGHRFAAHTNVRLYSPSGVSPEEKPPYPGYGYETPASLACHYGLVTVAAGISPNCNPNSTTVVPTGGSKSIAIVDAYDDPSAQSDLAWFSLQFGIPLSVSQIQVVWANTLTSSCNFSGVPTDYSGGWEVEESLDIEWAHAMAPGANIYLVEACSNYDTDLQQAVLVANNLVKSGGTCTGINPSSLVLTSCSGTNAGMVSMSWGGGEFAGENANDSCATVDDSCFTTPNVVYFASSGDSPGVIWPGTSPNVVSAGGTTVRRNSSTFNFIQETAWVEAGGGYSAIEAKPSYQSAVTNIAGTKRGVPDLSFDADPYTGVYVYDTFPVEGYYYYEWLIVGGTSVSAPSLAGIVNRAEGTTGWATSSNNELTYMYAHRTTTADYTDIGVGYCGFYMGLSTVGGWDPCTGIGTDVGYVGK